MPTPKNTKPDQTKRIIYLICSTILGLLLSIIAHALLEISYLRWAQSQNFIVPFYYGCAFHPAFSVVLLGLGALGGFLLGRFWWRIIYVERIRWKK